MLLTRFIPLARSDEYKLVESKNGANCSAMSLPPARSSTACFIMPVV